MIVSDKLSTDYIGFDVNTGYPYTESGKVIFGYCGGEFRFFV
jgi:hypothetical protein